MRFTRIGYLLALVGMTFVSSAAAIDSGPSSTDTRMLTQPAVSEAHIAFVYDRDLWIADRDGSNPRRLTSHEGTESSPRFSPDGQSIAFSAQYDGNRDVYLIANHWGTAPAFDVSSRRRSCGRLHSRRICGVVLIHAK